MRDYDFTIAENSEDRRNVLGNFIKVTNASVVLRVRAEDEEGKSLADLLLSQGGEVKDLPSYFHTVRVENTTGNPTTATLVIGVGSVGDNQLTGEVSIGQGQTLNQNADTVTTTPAEIVAADTTRRSVAIQNLDTSNPVYIGDSGVTTANGFKIAPDSGLVIDKSATASIWAVSAAGTPELRILEELD